MRRAAWSVFALSLACYATAIVTGRDLWLARGFLLEPVAFLLWIASKPSK